MPVNPLKLLQWARSAENASGVEGSAKYFYDASKALQPGKLAPLSDAETERLIRAVQQGHNRVVTRFGDPARDERHLLAIRDNFFDLPGPEKGFHVDLTPGGPAAAARENNVRAGRATRARPLSVAMKKSEKTSDALANDARALEGFRRKGVDSVIYSPTEGEMLPTGVQGNVYNSPRMDEFFTAMARAAPGQFQPSAAILKPENVRDLFEAEFKNPKATGFGYAKGGAVKADNKSEIDRLLAKYPGPRDVRYAPQLEGRGSELKNQFPGTYGFLGGLMGTVPDEFERGSVLSDDERARDTAVTKGAEYGYPLSVMANAAPLLSGIGGLAAKYGPGIAKAAAKNAAAPTTLSKQAGVIKAPGGNWLSGSVEDALKGLKKEFRRPAKVGPDVVTDEMWDEFLKTGEGAPQHAMNNWIDKQLTRYVKNDMATERDPVRALAERGVLHYAPHGFDTPRLSTQLKRQSQKVFPPERAVLADSDVARRWENASDSAVASTPMAEYQDFGSSNLTREQPWLAKLDPEAPMYRYDAGTSNQDLGFNHLIDELRNATNPQSGLPADLLLKYDALDKVSVPQAVERVAKINEWRAAQKAEADLARANNAATVLHKEYPEQGMKWVELKQSDKLPEGWAEEFVDTDLGKLRKFRDPKTGGLTATDPTEEALRDALKYEGDTMGHCVGGYCDDVASGASRIYSLRDAKGRPHVTVEVKPSDWYDQMKNRSLDDSKLFNAQFKAKLAESGLDPKGRGPEATNLGNSVYAELFGSAPEPTIIQIKGKGNKKPNDEYLPFVQDFVKSGKWSDVGDLGNTGLEDVGRFPKRVEALGGRYVTRQQLDDYLDSMPGERFTPPTEGFAKGGAVKAPHPCGCDKGYAAGGLVQYDPDRINSLVDQLRAEFA